MLHDLVRKIQLQRYFTENEGDHIGAKPTEPKNKNIDRKKTESNWNQTEGRIGGKYATRALFEILDFPIYRESMKKTFDGLKQTLLH